MTKFMLLTTHDSGSAIAPMPEWDPDDITAHMDYLRALNRELAENGELIEVRILAAPEMAKKVSAGSASSPVVTDGPFAEAKEILAGYQLIDVESEDRALEIAALVSAAPGPGGVPIGQSIEVRQVMGTLGEDL